MGRSAVAAVVPTTVLPDTLKRHRYRQAERDQEPEHGAGARRRAWADTLLQGDPARSPGAIAQLASTSRRRTLQKAKADRLSALSRPGRLQEFWAPGPRRCGPSSRQYQGRLPQCRADKSEDAVEVTGTRTPAGRCEGGRRQGAARRTPAAAAKADAGKSADAAKVATNADAAKPAASADAAKPTANADAAKPAAKADATAAPESVAVPSVH
jgi:hypothetical protein